MEMSTGFSMKNWYVGINDYWFSASLIMSEVPVVLHYLEHVVSWICSIIPDIPLPKIRFKLKDKSSWEYTDNSDGWITMKDWFGDTQQVFHCYVCTPVHNFVRKHTKSVYIEMPYNFLKEKFPAEFKKDLESEWDDEDIKFRIKTKRLADWSDIYFRKVYRTLNFEYIKKAAK